MEGSNDFRTMNDMDKHDKTDKHRDAKDSDSAVPTGAKQPAAHLVKVKFSGVVLICRECERRSSGPSKFTAKDVRKEFKRNAGDSSLRMRIVECGCLGLCPKKAIAVVASATGKTLQAAELCSAEEAPGVLFALEKTGSE